MKLSEVIELPISIGDTILTGRFKNKKMTVKSIDYDDNGQLLVNGRKALTFRIAKLMNKQKTFTTETYNFRKNNTVSRLFDIFQTSENHEEIANEINNKLLFSYVDKDDVIDIAKHFGWKSSDIKKLLRLIITK